MSETVRLFVYGTLKRGGRLHATLAGQRFLGPARTRPGYVLLHCGWHPGLVRRDGGGSVEGELYEIEAALLPRLDEVEGVPDVFRREPIVMEDGTEAVAYFFCRDDGTHAVIPDGRWAIS